MSLVEALLLAAYGSNQRQERIGTQVDWHPIKMLLQPMRKAPTGRPAYTLLVQLKALLLQHLRGLLNAPSLQPACRSCRTARVPPFRSQSRRSLGGSVELSAVLRAGPGGDGP